MKIKKIKYFQFMIDFILNHIRMVCFFCATLALYLFFLAFHEQIATLLNIDVSENSLLNRMLPALITFPITTSATFILAKLKFVNNMIFKVKRTLYNKLLLVSEKNTVSGKISSHCITKFYRYQRMVVNTQITVKNQVLQYLQDENKEANFIWIKGTAFSGKTSSIMHLLRDLITDDRYKDLYKKLDGKIYYFDIGKHDFDLDAIIKKYTDRKFIHDVLIFDNMHKLSFDDFNEKVKTLLMNHNCYAAIFLTREPEDYISDSLKIERMNQYMNRMESKCLDMKPLSVEEYTLHEDTSGYIEVLNIIRSYKFCDEKNIGFHFLNLYRCKHPYVQKIIDFLLTDYQDPEFYEYFIITICASIFTGNFDQNEVIYMNSEMNKHKYKKFLLELESLGIITFLPAGSSGFYQFNEDLAKFYFYQGYVNFKDHYSYIRMIEKLQKSYEKSEKYMLSFLYGALSAQDEVKHHYIFTQIAMNVNFKNLFDQLEYIFNLIPDKKAFYYKELGILCDRMGKLKDAKDYFLKCNLHDDIEIFYRLLQIDHSFIDKKKELNLEEQDKYIQLLDQYWNIHMKMHEGEFLFQEMKLLVKQCTMNFKDIILHNKYDGLHLMRRIYFDSFRLYYLTGTLDYREIICVLKEPIKQYLNAQLYEFSSYQKKFAVGQLLGYDVLFDLTIFKKYLNKEDFKAMFDIYEEIINFERLTNWKECCKYSIQFLSEAANEMKMNGDKTYIFVLYHMNSLKMCLPEFAVSEAECFQQIYTNFAQEQNIIEYRVYAILYSIRLKLLQLFFIGTDNCNFEYDQRITEIDQEFSRIRNELSLCTYHNKYEHFRIDFLSCFFDFYKTKNENNFQFSLCELEEKAIDLGYNRELRMIQSVKNKNYKLSFQDIGMYIRFYPLVTQ